MRIATLSDFLLQHIDRASGKPVNRQIYQVVREAILDHVLPWSAIAVVARPRARVEHVAQYGDLGL